MRCRVERGWTQDVGSVRLLREARARTSRGIAVPSQLLTLAPLVFLGTERALRSGGWLLFGFLLFRALDIAKFGPIGWAERNFRGGAGVMMDDVVAGVIGGVVLGSLYVAAVAFGFAS